MVLPLLGTCRFGSKCRFAHGSDELRPKLIQNTNVVKPFKMHKMHSELKPYVPPMVINIQKSVPLDSSMSYSLLSASALPQEMQASHEGTYSWKDVYKPLNAMVDPFFEGCKEGAKETDDENKE